ncbi:DNA ligase D [Paraburkholderia strydomiana]|uniref:DNA ligase D n=1 Tax=Paraburkholderia strydomiana TaxID=1245417 RepID=UPI001BE502B3|nr:DNA ligase D [Paraburkholderia strydomiana]MBT2793343.1 DNA ligase D [Paraburkholderia strydomiana]
MGRWNRANPVGVAAQADQSEGGPPALIQPQLATLVDRPPKGGDWSYEIKFDGYRVMTRIEGGVTTIFTRNGHDWTERMPRLADACNGLQVDDAWLDGEAVVLDSSGQPDFNSLQNAFDRRSTAEIVMFVFDLLWLNGTDLREQPLRARRALLRDLMAEQTSDAIRFSEDFPQDPVSLVASACKMKLEGIIGKRGDAPYRSGRSAAWVKIKCYLRQEFVVGGFTRAKGARSGLHSLLLGVHEKDGSLRYAGSVRPYFSSRAAAAFVAPANAVRSDSAVFYNPPKPEKERDYLWIEPSIVVECSFLEWTPGGEVRHPVFHAVRDDKPAAAVTEETMVPIEGGESVEIDAGSTREAPEPKGSLEIAGLRITNAQRVMDEVTGHTKRELVEYYAAIAQWALPHLHNRPLTLVRAPDGIKGELFFQKHSEKARIPGVTELPPELHPRHPPLLVANSEEALVALAQMGVVEIHTWNAAAPDLEHPDRIIFDLDPDPALPWTAMLEAASLMKVVLDQIGLRSFPKTSGGKGFHIVVPLARRQGWSETKAFAHAVAKHMAHVVPQRFSAVLGPKNRVGKIFIDYLRNSRGASTVAAFSVRARPGMGVAMPVSWDELQEIRRGDEWTMPKAVERQRSLKKDPWQGYWQTRQGITAAMRRAVGLV